MNVNGINNVNSSQGSSKLERAGQNPAEIMLFAPRTPEAQNIDGEILNYFNGYNGNIAGKEFELERKEAWGDEYEITGNIAGQKVDIEEEPVFCTNGKANYKGKIGKNPIVMQAEGRWKDELNRMTYKGQYKGKTFTIEYSDTSVVPAWKGDRVMKGKFGDKEVVLKYNYNSFSETADIDETKLPEGFEDVAILIMTIDKDQTKRKNDKK